MCQPGSVQTPNPGAQPGSPLAGVIPASTTIQSPGTPWQQKALKAAQGADKGFQAGAQQPMQQSRGASISPINSPGYQMDPVTQSILMKMMGGGQ